MRSLHHLAGLICTPHLIVLGSSVPNQHDQHHGPDRHDKNLHPGPASVEEKQIVDALPPKGRSVPAQRTVEAIPCCALQHQAYIFERIDKCLRRNFRLHGKPSIIRVSPGRPVRSTARRGRAWWWAVWVTQLKPLSHPGAYGQTVSSGGSPEEVFRGRRPFISDAGNRFDHDKRYFAHYTRWGRQTP